MTTKSGLSGNVPDVRALITGGAGFVGRNLRRRLYSDGWEVDALDVRAFSVDRRQRGVTGWRQDARDFFRGSTETRYDLAVHAAARVGGRRMIEGAPDQQLVNFALDAEYFMWLEQAKPRHAVYLSSSSVYPTYLQTGEYPRQLEESDVTFAAKVVGVPDATYGMAKLVGEHMAANVMAPSTSVHVVRPFSGYGTDQDLDYPFPSFIRRVKQRERPFKIWGDGRQVRDWVHIDDVIGAILAIVEQDVRRPVNVGWGRPTSFLELYELMHDVAQVPRPPVRLMETEPRGVAYRVCDPTRLREIYTPKITLEEGIARALRA